MAGNDPRDISIKVTANTSQMKALTAGRMYSASMRLLKREDEGTYTAYYTPKQPLNMCPSEDSPELVNQMTMCGLGIVVSREETTPDDVGEAVLFTTLCHTDWDPEAKKLVSFDVIYATPKKGTLANALGLFQIGRELFLTGLIVDWDAVKKTWIVQTLTVCISSGHQTLKATTDVGTGSSYIKSGRKRKFVDTLVPQSPESATRSPSTSSLANNTFHKPHHLETTPHYAQRAINEIDAFVEDTERAIETHHTPSHSPELANHNHASQVNNNIVPSEDLTFKNTYVKGRSKRDILNDAKRRAAIE